MAQFQAVNNDSVTSVPGDIVESSGQAYGCVPAQATTGNLALVGVWQTTTTVGASGVVKDDLVEVNCAVTVTVGDKLYLSAATAGKATNVAPANPYFVGVAVSTRVVSTVQKATINFVRSTVAGDINAAGLALATSIAPGAMSAAQNNVLNGLSENTVNAMAAPYYASGDIRTTTTSGTTAPGTSVTLATDIGFVAHQGIFIGGAGPAGGDYVGTVVSAVGTALVVTPATSTSVSNGAWVAHDDTTALQSAIDDTFAAGGGTILGRGFSRINGPLQDPSGANGILILPDRIATFGSVPVDITIKGASSPAFSDQGSPTYPSAGGWIIACNKDDRAGTGAMLSGRHNAGDGWGHFTFAFLTLEDVTFRAPAGTLINGINAYDIARVTMRGHVVVETGPVTALAAITYDKYAVQFPAFNCVPPGQVDSLTVSSFYRGVKAYERTHIAYLYATYCLYPVEVNGGLLVIDSGTFDVWKSAFRTTSGGFLKVGAVALDQGDYIVDDPSNLLTGEITVTKGSGQMGMCGGSKVIVNQLGKMSKLATTVSTFRPQGFANAAIYNIAIHPNGNVYRTIFGANIEMQTGGVGAFATVGPSTQNWTALTVDTTTGDVWAFVFGGKGWKQTAGAGAFVEQSAITSRNWGYAACNKNGRIYVTVSSGDVYYYNSGSGNVDLTGMSVGSYAYAGITCRGNLDVLVCIYGGGISVQALGSGTFSAIVGVVSANYNGMASSPNGDDYVCVRGGDILCRKAGAAASAWLPTGQTSRNWYGIATGGDGTVLAGETAGDMYQQFFAVVSAIPMS